VKLFVGDVTLQLDELIKWIGEREKELASELPDLTSWEAEVLRPTIELYTARMKVSLRSFYLVLIFTV